MIILLGSGATSMISIDRDRDVYGRLLRDVSADATMSARR